MRLCRKLVEQNPEGPIFRNNYGRPYSRNAVRIRFRSLRAKLGIKGVVPYTARHTFCTEGLEKGIPIATMAELLGHSSVRMVSQHYNHLSEKTDHLKNAVRIVTKRNGCVSAKSGQDAGGS